MRRLFGVLLAVLTMLGTASCTEDGVERPDSSTSMGQASDTVSGTEPSIVAETTVEENGNSTGTSLTNMEPPQVTLPYSPDPLEFERDREALRPKGGCSRFNNARALVLLGSDGDESMPAAYAAVLGGDVAALGAIALGGEMMAEGLPPLIVLAASTGCVETTEVLLGADADPNTIDERTLTSVLWAAVRSRNPEVVKLVVDQGAAVDVAFEGETALHLAALLDLSDSVQILLEAGADPNAVSDYGESTPLTDACSQGGTEVVTLLLDAGATPLPIDLVAAARRIDKPNQSWPATAIVALLLESGADPTEYHAQIGGSARRVLEREGLTGAIQYLDYYSEYLGAG